MGNSLPAVRGINHKYIVVEGSIIIYSDTVLEKFMKYSQENHRGRKKKVIDE